MFTGIIKSVGRIVKVTDFSGAKELQIFSDFTKELEIDQSISINGVCHTVTELDEEYFTVQSVEETLRKTNIGGLKANDLVNLERSIRSDQLLDGHIVQGHVDAVGTITDIQQEGTDWLFTISYPEDKAELVVGRGSIALDGISLTVARVENSVFTVAIIPYTFEHTNLKNKKMGDSVNLEFDVLGKYVLNYLKKRDN